MFWFRIQHYQQLNNFMRARAENNLTSLLSMARLTKDQTQSEKK